MDANTPERPTVRQAPSPALSISRLKKERFLLGLSESEFRDSVVRVLFFRLGFQDGRELCGPTEEGKDCLFLRDDPFGQPQVWVVQTKRGRLNLTSKASENLITAETQLRTALKTAVPFLAAHRSVHPEKVILCSSGKINAAARMYIVSTIDDPRVSFLDPDELIPKIDEYYPELWLGIEAERLPYLRRLREMVLDEQEGIVLRELLPQLRASSPVSDDVFVPLFLHRTVFVPRKKQGRVEREPRFEQFPVSGLLNRRETRILILGEAGAGKSVALRRLAYLLIERGLQTPNKSEVPILLRFSDIAGSDSKLLDALTIATQRVSTSAKPSFSVDDLNNGTVWVLLDGLDEVASHDARVKVLSAIENFHRTFPQCKVIATSRDYGAVRNLAQMSRFVTFQLSPIDWKQTRQLVTKLQRKRSVGGDHVQEIVRRIQSVHGISLNPLLVTIFVAIFDDSRRSIPANITELFKKLTELLLGRWDAQKGIAQQFHAPTKDFLLSRLAFEMHKRGQRSIPLDECNRLLRDELRDRALGGGETDVLVQEAILRSGLFRVDGNIVEFRHMLLQEFFAGRGIPSQEFLESVIHDEWWQRAIVFYFGENPRDSAALVTSIAAVNSKSLSSEERCRAAIALGLALQACYLAKVEEKVSSLEWVIDTLAQGLTDLEDSAIAQGTPNPLMRIVISYLFGRDAVANEVLCSRAESIAIKWQGAEKKERDVRDFWLLVGLIECEDLDAAEKALRRFDPDDTRLFLPLHLGCFVIANLRVSPAEKKRMAERICARIAPRIAGFRQELIKELKSELLEVQQGEVCALPGPAETSAARSGGLGDPQHDTRQTPRRAQTDD